MISKDAYFHIFTINDINGEFNKMVDVSDMDESVIKSIDTQGRLIIPAEMRRGWKSDKVILTKENGTIRIIPLESKPPSFFFDSIQIDENVDLSDSHAVMKALRGKSFR